MDQTTKEYLEKILQGLTTKEDLEKLRQETKSNFRQLREENKNQILEWRQEIKADFEQLRKEGKVEIGPDTERIQRGNSRNLEWRPSLPLINRYGSWNHPFRRSGKK